MIQELSSIHEERTSIQRSPLPFLRKIKPTTIQANEEMDQPFVPEFYDKVPIKTINKIDSRLQVSISRIVNQQNTSYCDTNAYSLEKRYLELSTACENPHKNSTLYEIQTIQEDDEANDDQNQSNAKSFLEVSNKFFPQNNKSLSTEQVSFLLDKKSNNEVYLPSKKLLFYTLKLKKSVKIIGSVGSILEFKGTAFKIVKSDLPKLISFCETNVFVSKNANFMEISDKETKIKIANCFIKGESSKIISQKNKKNEIEINDGKRSNLDHRKSELIKSKGIENSTISDTPKAVFNLSEIPAFAKITLILESTIFQNFETFLEIKGNKQITMLNLFCKSCNFSFFKKFIEIVDREIGQINIEFNRCKINNIEKFCTILNQKSTDICITFVDCEFFNSGNMFELSHLTNLLNLKIIKTIFSFCKMPISVETMFSEIEIKNCTFFKNQEDCLLINNCKRLLCEKNKFIENYGGNVLNFYNVNGFVKNCFFSSNQKTCLQIQNITANGAFEISNSSFSQNLGLCLFLAKQNDKNVFNIINNSFKGPFSFIRIENFANCEVFIANNLFEAKIHSILCFNSKSLIRISANSFVVLQNNSQNREAVSENKSEARILSNTTEFNQMFLVEK